MDIHMLDLTQSGAFGQCEALRAPVRSRPVVHPAYELHGGSGTPEYKAWKGMLARCYLESTPGFENWGGRGIRVCGRWLTSFGDFLADVGHRPSGHSLDRIDVDGNYEPGNVRWATRAEQARNTRAVSKVEFRGVQMSLPDFAEAIGMNKASVAARLRRGWSLEEVASTPARRGTRLRNVRAGVKNAEHWFDCEECRRRFLDKTQKTTRRFCGRSCFMTNRHRVNREEVR
jgi:hypothetical protein